MLREIKARAEYGEDNGVKTYLAAILSFLLLPNAAYASEALSFMALLPYWINFLVFLLLLLWILNRHFPRHWEDRERRIREQVKKGERVLSEAKQRYRAALAYKERLPEVLAEIEQKIKAEEEAERESILRQGEQKARSIIASAKETVELEKRTAVARIKEDIVNELVRELESKVRENFTSVNDRELISRNCERLGELLKD